MLMTKARAAARATVSRILPTVDAQAACYQYSYRCCGCAESGACKYRRTCTNCSTSTGCGPYTFVGYGGVACC